MTPPTLPRWTAVLVLSACGGALVQGALVAQGKPMAAPEAAVSVGYWRVGSDEGGIDSGPAYGGSVRVPIWKGLAAGADVVTGRVATSQAFREGRTTYETRRTLVAPILAYRFGANRRNVFIGAGVGVEFEDSTSVQTGIRPTGQNWREVSPQIFELRRTDLHRSISVTTGFAAFSSSRVGLRVEGFIASWHTGARVAVAYRLR